MLRQMRGFGFIFTLLFASAPAFSQTRLVRVSGDGQLAQLFNAFTQPLVVQALDSAGRPLAGRSVTWNDVGGINYASPKVTVTDAAGMASLSWVPGGEIGPGVPYRQYTVTAASDVGSTTFSLVSYPFISGAFNPQPTIQLVKPAQGSNPLSVQTGGRAADAIRIIVVTSGGNAVSPGLPIPGVGLTVTSANQDPAAGPVASCAAGTVLTGADGSASCELLALGRPGSTELLIDVGSQVSFKTQLQVTGGDPTPVIVQGNNQSGLPGQPLPLRLTARLQDPSGNPWPGATAVWTALPPGSVTLTGVQGTADASGLVSAGVTLGATPGAFEVRVNSGANYASFQVIVTGAAPGLTVTSAALPAGTAGVAYSQSLGATGGAPPYSWAQASGILPPGMSIASNGLVSGIPGTGGTFAFAARVTDSKGATATGNVTLTIGAGLAVATVVLPQGAVGAPYSQTLAAAGGTPPFTWSLASGGIVASQLPAGLSLSAAGVISGTPLAAGSTTFTIRVRDAASKEAFQLYTLIIGTTPIVPLAVATTSPLPAATAGLAYSTRLAATGGAGPFVWVIAAGTVPPGLVLASDGLLAGTPTTPGSYGFTVRVTDSRSSQATLALSLTVAGTVSITTASLPKASMGVPYQQTLSATGGTPPYLWTVGSGTLPAGLSLSTAGLLSGTPAAAGVFFFSPRVADSTGASASALLAVEVNATPTLTRAGIIAQLATGGGWKTSLNLFNVQTVSAQVRIQFTSQEGAGLDLPYVITQAGQSLTQVGSAVERTLPPNGSLLIETEAPISSTLVGWADVRSTVPVSGYAIFRQRGQDGRDSEGTSPLETRAQAGVLVPFDNLTGYSTGVALVNLSSAAANVTSIWRDESGVEIGREIVPLPANGHTSFSLPDKFPALSGRRGTVEFQSNQSAGVAALGLRFNPTLSFTSVPVAVRQ